MLLRLGLALLFFALLSLGQIAFAPNTAVISTIIALLATAHVNLRQRRRR